MCWFIRITNLIILVFIVFKMLNNEMCFPSVLLGDFEKIVDLVQLLAVSSSVPHTLHIHTHTSVHRLRRCLSSPELASVFRKIGELNALAY